MEEQTSWKGHTFTLLVFTGIVVLCSIFFILGMLVGRGQGQKLALSAASAQALKTDAKPASTDDKPDFTFYDSVKKQEPSSLQQAPKDPDPPPALEPPKRNDPPAQEPPAVTSKPENVFNYQIGAVRKPTDAEKLLTEVKKRGFRGFILSPAADDPKPLFRVQVGPFADLGEAQEAKRNLESAG